MLLLRERVTSVRVRLKVSKSVFVAASVVRKEGRKEGEEKELRGG